MQLKIDPPTTWATAEDGLLLDPPAVSGAALIGGTDGCKGKGSSLQMGAPISCQVICSRPVDYGDIGILCQVTN